MKDLLNKIDLTEDQKLFELQKDGVYYGSVEIIDDEIVTEGLIGHCTYQNIIELLYGLQGFDLGFDNIYFQ